MGAACSYYLCLVLFADSLSASGRTSVL